MAILKADGTPLTRNEMELYDKCQRYRQRLISVLEHIPSAKRSQEWYIIAQAILGEDYGREGRCLFDPTFYDEESRK